jgi:hypothetical protein
MSYLMVHFWPAGTEEQYRTMLETLHAGGVLPEGQTHHVAGPTEGGFLISALWDSKEHADAFDARIGALMPIEGGFAGHPEARTASVVSEQGA